MGAGCWGGDEFRDGGIKWGKRVLTGIHARGKDGAGTIG